MIQNVMGVEDDNPFGFVGREQELEILDTFLKSHRSLMYIYGPSGIGKTALVRQFLKTYSYDVLNKHQVFWFSFPNLRTIEFILNCLAAAYSAHTDFFSLSIEDKIDMLSYLLSINTCTIVIDNFEQARSNQSSFAIPAIPEEEIRLFETLCKKINGSSTKILIISAQEDIELIEFDQEDDYFFDLNVQPLDEISNELLTHSILQFYDIHADLNQKDMCRLLKIANGHPLSMKILLSRLLYQTPELLIAKYHQYRHTVIQIGNLSPVDYHTHLMTLMHMIVTEIPNYLMPIIPSLSFYEGSIESDLLHAVIDIYQTSSMGFVPDDLIKQMVQELMDFLEHNQLVAKYIPGTKNYQLMPLFTEYTRRISMECEPYNIRADWAGAFIHVVARLSASLKTMDNFGKQLWYHFNDATFHQAYEEACKYQMHDHSGILLQIIAIFARINRNFAKAERSFIELASIHQALNDYQMQGIALFQLAQIADEQGNYQKAEKFLQKTLRIFEKEEKEYEIASVCHQLGRIAHQTGKIEHAKGWLTKALNIVSRVDFSYEEADITLQLARIDYEQKKFTKAEKWYKRAVEIFKEYGDDYRTATVYQQLGTVANDMRDFGISEHWFHKAMKIYERLGLENNLITIYHKTAEAAQAQRHFKTAEKWYAKTFGMIKDTSNISYLASLYRSVGKLAREQGNYSRADKLYQMSHSIYEKIYDEDEENIPYSELLLEMSILKGLNGQFEAAGRYTIDSIMALDQLRNTEEVQYRTNNFKLTYWQAPEQEKERLKEYWEENVGEFPIKE